MKIVLDLYSGSKSWSKGFRERGFVCLSLDNDPTTKPTWCVSIHDWEPPPGLRGAVDVICIGVPCTAYSTACKKKSEERFEATRAMWRRSFELCESLLKSNGVILAENPARTELTGCCSRPIGDMEMMNPTLHRNRLIVNYCRYSSPDALFSWKQTVIWSNVDLRGFGFEPKTCSAAERCSVGEIDMRTGFYKHRARMTFCAEPRNRTIQIRAKKWSSMPHRLCQEVAEAADRALARTI